MTATITLLATVNNYNGSIYVDIYQQGRLIYSQHEFKSGANRIAFDVSWPGTIDIITSNRNLVDTQTDENNCVIATKAIEITGILINQFAVHIDSIDQLFNCYRENNSTVTHENFWDFNGKIQMHLTHSSPMRFMLSLQNQFDGNRLEWENNG